jgi:hypothetical protein
MTNAERAAVIAAQPGYFVLNATFGSTPDEPPVVSREPVIAWKVDMVGHTLRPLCVDEALDGDNAEAWAILYPGGKVLDREKMIDFNTIEDWLAYHKDEYEAELAAGKPENARQG